jgi:hypothetical protein
LDLLTATFKKIDHNENFCNALRSLGQRSPQYINELIASFSESHRKFVTDLLQTRKIVFQEDGEEKTVSRKLIKVKRRFQPAQQQQHLELPAK